MSLESKLAIAKKELKEFLLFSIRTQLPMTKKEKREYLERVEDKVKFYKPRMEEKVGFKLEGVQIKTYKEFFNYAKNELHKHVKEEIKKLEKTNLSTLERKLYPYLFKGIANLGVVPLLKIYTMYTEDVETFSYKDSVIYVPFGLSTKSDLFSKEQYGVDRLDRGVVHELSHHLWMEVRKRDKCEEEKREKGRRIWAEGFAEYCTLDYFEDIYPKDYQMKKVVISHPIYEKGYEKMENLVREHGKDIVLQVPSKWRRFNVIAVPL